MGQEWCQDDTFLALFGETMLRQALVSEQSN
jgi:hypothetical protein